MLTNLTLIQVDLPYYEIQRNTIGFLAKKLLIIAYFLIIYAPLAMGIARYDFYGSVVALLYTWMITIHNYVRDRCWLFYINFC